jgi:hypothetical protein
MYIRKSDRPVFVTDHMGNRISCADLPPIGTTRWVARRKAMVVSAVEGGLITREEAIEMYELSAEEFESWARHLNAHGPLGLRATAVQRYR